MAGLADTLEFEDFDNEDVYNKCQAALLQPETLNFVVQFNDRNATAAGDISESTMQMLMEADQSSVQSTRWINIFGPERQKELVRKLAARYRFSPRLSGLMCSDHQTPVSVPSSPHRNSISRYKAQVGAQNRLTDSISSDLEMNDMEVPHEPKLHTFDMSLYKLVNEVWHYNSVDWGPKYLCISYNYLADTNRINGGKDPGPKQADGDTNEGNGHSSNKPEGARTWTWLVLCDDGTIISMYETLPNQLAGLGNIRRNLRNVFGQLSKVKNDSNKQPINALEIRPGLSLAQSSNLNIADCPSLLFYYLFDDWYTTYALVAKDQHQYAQKLENLRENMFSKPQVPLINQLHQYGRELAVLKRMYQSYAHIIERVLGGQKPMSTSTVVQLSAQSSGGNRNVQGINLGSDIGGRAEPEAGDPNVPTEAQTLGVPLSAMATVRFERLLDRINHLALNEIQECLDEKESLVFLNFNLLAMKESQAVERLTRITILLAKVTIFFMPVSIMTAYFSTQLSDIAGKYTVKTYWICFGVIMTLSFVFLLIFGLASGTVEGKPIYRTLTQTVFDMGKGKLMARRHRKRQ